MRSILLFFVAAFVAKASVAQVTANKITAEEIIQRSINNNGGEKLLDSISSTELVSKIAEPNGDTLSFAIKRSEFDKYYISVLSAGYENTTTIYNHGQAVIIKNDSVHKVTDPIKLEAYLLQCYISVDYAYKRLGYKLKRLDDQKFENFDCFVVNATSPLGRDLMNFYDKKTGNLIMVIYPDDNKAVLIDFYQNKGITIPSTVLLTRNGDKITRSELQKLSYPARLDPNWFALPKEGEYKIPEIFKTGIFNYADADSIYNTKIIRTSDMNIEEDDKSKIEFKVIWKSSSEYDLYNLNSQDRNYKIRIVTWDRDKYYYQYLSSDNIGGTGVFKKIKNN